MNNLKITLAAIGTLSVLALMPTHAQIIITEVDPTGSTSANNTYKQDWFELTNEGSSTVSISGFVMNDDTGGFSGTGTNAPTALLGVSQLTAGQSAVFIESPDAVTADINSLESTFKSFWFGSNVPSSFTMGYYVGGSTTSVGLGSSGDQVNIWNSSGVLQAAVDFGASTAGVSFDNSVAQITNNGTISTLSAIGVNGAFASVGTGTGTQAGIHEIGSPGAVPEPSSGVLAALAGLVLGGFAWYRKNALRA